MGKMDNTNSKLISQIHERIFDAYYDRLKTRRRDELPFFVRNGIIQKTNSVVKYNGAGINKNAKGMSAKQIKALMMMIDRVLSAHDEFKYGWIRIRYDLDKYEEFNEDSVEIEFEVEEYYDKNGYLLHA